MNKPLAAIKNVSHTWPSSGTQACRDISLNLHAGSVHALVGENGAGKTTLGHILAGVTRPDSGRLFFRDRERDLTTRTGRHGGILDGIGLVRQRSIWPRTLELWEAAVLGREKTFSGRSTWTNLFTETLKNWNLGELNPRQSVSRTDAAALQRAQMASALMFRPEILILDEPASAWEEGRSEEFFGLIELLKSEGKAVLLITHRIEDVFRTAKNVTVLRHGKVVMDAPVADLSQDEVMQAMFDRSVLTLERMSFSDSPEDTVAEKAGDDMRETQLQSVRIGEYKAVETDRPAIRKKTNAKVPPHKQVTGSYEAPSRLSARNLFLRISGREELQNINFDVKSGEILAITGLREGGMDHLEQIVTGNILPTSGELSINGNPAPCGVSGMRKAGLRYVPSDVFGKGASLTSTMAENLMVLESQTLSFHGWLGPKKVHDWTEQKRRSGNISGRPDQKLEELSGGNIQKVILHRELCSGALFLVLADPTRALDEMSRKSVHGRIRELIRTGTAVLLLASELDEALELSSRMAVLSAGRLSPVLPTSSWNRLDAAHYIAGRRAG